MYRTRDRLRQEKKKLNDDMMGGKYLSNESID